MSQFQINFESPLPLLLLFRNIVVFTFVFLVFVVIIQYHYQSRTHVRYFGFQPKCCKLGVSKLFVVLISPVIYRNLLSTSHQ